MENLKDIVKSVIQQISTAEPGDIQALQDAWNRISRPHNRYTRIHEWKETCLLIHTDSTVRLYTLNINKQKYLKKLQEQFPSIQQLYFKIGKI